VNSHSLISVGLSDVGRKRPHNEDSFFADDDLGLYVVADGVGGHAKGEVASAEAVEQVVLWVKGKDSQGAIVDFLADPNDDHRRVLKRVVESGVQSACYMVFGMAEQDPERKGMSTTISALLIAGDRAFIGQVGDSRVYRMRDGEVSQLTEDHTLINYKLKKGLITPEEAANAPGKNVITRAVGHKDYVEVDTFEADVRPGDRFLLCSDGLHGYLEDSDIAPILGQELAAAAQCFIDLANDRGGKDNITALVVSAT
jgi:protein phosphatase